MEIKSILFPVDFSDRCAAVVPQVEAAPGVAEVIDHISIVP